MRTKEEILDTHSKSLLMTAMDFISHRNYEEDFLNFAPKADVEDLKVLMNYELRKVV